MTEAIRLGTLRGLLLHSGVVSGRRLDALLAADRLRHNDAAGNADATPQTGDRLLIDGRPYRVVPGGAGRLQVAADGMEPGPIAAPVRLHAGYHKCMTEFTKRVYRLIGRVPLRPRVSFEHFFHRLDAFYNHCTRQTICSLSGHAVDLDRFADIRVVRVVRDPRDLLVSAYHYHRRGAEDWCRLPDPVEADLWAVNGAVPSGLRGGESLRDYLQRVPLQDGLAAEFEFRRHHLESMRAWPLDDPRVRLFRYEDMLGNEAATFWKIVRFLRLPAWTPPAAAWLARRHAADARGGKPGHIRNPASGQWREHFGPQLRRRFAAEYGDVLERYGYPPD